MKIAIYGGAFNPIHSSHIAFANLISNHVDAVWLMPCKNHAFNKSLASVWHRILMIAMAITENNNPKITVSFFEITNDFNGSSYDMLKKLTEIHPEHEFVFAIGEDCADQIKLWKNSEKLIKEFPFIVVGRRETPSKETWFKESPHTYIQETVPSMSSTQIRNLVETNSFDKLNDFLTADVIKYIKDNELYRA